jgi:DNA-binding transcriptional regulator of glucitol operon
MTEHRRPRRVSMRYVRRFFQVVWIVLLMWLFYMLMGWVNVKTFQRGIGVYNDSLSFLRH